MAKFEVLITPIGKVEHHPNADRLSIMKVGGFTIVSGKLEDGSHRYNEGDLVAYVPENAVVPVYLLKRGYWDENKQKGFLAGSEGNRVKPVKLRDVVSQGIVFPPDEINDGCEKLVYINGSDERLAVAVGDDVSEFLGITKFEPVIPASMDGDVVSIGDENTVKFDIENILKYMDGFERDEPIVVTEKLHGTFCGIGYVPGLAQEGIHRGEFFAFSKGLGSKGLVFKDTEENRKSNLYLRSAIENDLFVIAEEISRDFDGQTVHILGEIFGKGVQDLHYGVDYPMFRAFDIVVGGEYLDYEQFLITAKENYLQVVPELYRDGYDFDKLKGLLTGKTTFGQSNVLEGGVVKSIHGERKIFKLINEEYLTRKGNTTEFN